LLTLVGLGTFSQEGVVSQNIQVGIEVPDFEIQVLTSEGSVMTNMRDYRGKVVILEFWATYCGPCLPAMDHLAKVWSNFTSEVEVFAITDEPRSKVVSSLSKRPTSLLVALDDDKTLNRLFYHQFMPHTVIIGPDGFVKAITSPDQITKELIYVAKSGADLTVKTKAEFANINVNDTALVPYSLEDNSFYKVIISPQAE
jgi:thiol-disulfide isomerase/thioredoxin